ncbi:MAG: prepilin-type N-terminal cleavage/methylation domain-containing protein [Longimicrobiales bacterium]
MLTHDTPRRDGFTLVEVVISLVILSVAVLGMGVSASRLATVAATAELKALAIQAADDRIARVRLDPRYAALDSVYGGEEENVIGPNTSRTTQVRHIQETNPPLDYKIILVSVSAPFIGDPVTRQIVIGAP